MAKKLYRLTMGTASRIRSTREGVDILMAEGYVFDGEVAEDPKAVGGYKVINTAALPEADEKDLMEMSIKELKARCKADGLEGYSKLGQDELIELISGV